MAKLRREPIARRQTRTSPRRNLESSPSPVTSASLTELLKTAGTSPVMTQSGIVQPSSHFARPRLHWPGWAGEMPAPPPRSKVLWVMFSVDWQIYTWNSFGPTNNSNSPIRLDCGITWRWHITPNPFYFAEPLPEFILGAGRQTFYTSVSPGAVGFEAAWIAPAASKTLTPDSKESDPTPLAMLLACRTNGMIPLWFGMDFSDVTVNGNAAGGYAIGGGANDFYWSYAYIPGRQLPVISPTDAIVTT